MFIDTHCHIKTSEVKDYIKSAKDNDVLKLIVASEDYESSKACVEMAKDNNNLFACVGIHPLDVDTYSEKEMDKFRELANLKCVVAIGEIGLDYHYSKENKELQETVFRKFLELAESVNKPVVIHTREAISDTIKILKEYNVRGVVHAFSGSVESAKELVKMGFALGIGGVLTFKNSKLYQVVEEIPLESIVLETDAPYLTPEPYRGKPNKSAYIPIIAQKVGEYKGKSVEEIEEVTTRNAVRIFDI